ncbi:hypothetical protein KDK95_33770 [Actinospica sp. MGRD01-02]|uniref:DUF4177 domain-containing protein n=1 Tax=Actinospica acidithermotolerans TaxID=2828514 RepID=A0A941EIT7_9ACTN|nr:hypothetical protein [Actinospica acidithermotolerans]MBR7831322.1 hypothetical protein [Actinospica acidithermotolerans]
MYTETHSGIEITYIWGQMLFTGEIVSYIANAAAAGIIGNRVDAALASSLEPVGRLHKWLRQRRMEPARLEASPAGSSWVQALTVPEQVELKDLLASAIYSVHNQNVIASNRNYSSGSGVAVGNMYGGSVTQNNYGTNSASSNWEYATVDYCQEGNFDPPPHLKWVAYISFPGRPNLDVRDNVQIAHLLSELGRDGWELVDQNPSTGINGTVYTLKRPRR